MSAPLTRRAFLKRGAVAALGFGALPGYLARAAAAGPGGRKKTLVVLFQRGGADGLNLVVPYGEAAYKRLRPVLALPAPGKAPAGAALDLDGFFGLHPEFAPLLPLWKERSLAVVHAAGSPDATLSHFDAQAYMEAGTPGDKTGRDGWLNRCLHAHGSGEADAAFRAVAMTENLPLTLQGAAPALSVPDLAGFQLMAAHQGFEELYAATPDAALGPPGRRAFEAIEILRAKDPAKLNAENGAVYPFGQLGQRLQQVAQLIKADVGLEAAFVENDGWDTHVNEDNTAGYSLAGLARELARALAAFHADLGSRMSDVVLVTLSEFGRAAQENGNRGTDHGHGTCMLVLGGPVRGGKVYGRWPGLEPAQLHAGRALAVTTDFRAALGELLAGHLGARDLKAVFPGFSRPKPLGLLG